MADALSLEGTIKLKCTPGAMAAIASLAPYCQGVMRVDAHGDDAAKATFCGTIATTDGTLIIRKIADLEKHISERCYVNINYQGKDRAVCLGTGGKSLCEMDKIEASLPYIGKEDARDLLERLRKRVEADQKRYP